MNSFRILTSISLGAALIPSLSQARFAIVLTESEIIEIPRSQTKTYLERGSIEQSLKQVKTQKPGALSDEELAAIPERYLPPDLQAKQKAIKEKLKTQQAPKKLAEGARFLKENDVVKIKTQNKGVVDIKIDEAVWVPPTAATNEAILAPEKKLPDVEVLKDLKIETSGTVAHELKAGDRREIQEVFSNGKTDDPEKKRLLAAFTAYQNLDYATAVTLALGRLSDAKSSEAEKTSARYLAAHSLYQAGFYASALPLLIDLVTTKWRRSAVGMAAHALEKARDDGAANEILAKLSLSQIAEEDRPLFAFHLGRILLNTGAREAALAAFMKVPPEHKRYPEAQYYMGVLLTSDVPASVSASDWDNKNTAVFAARTHFEQALVASRTNEANDLIDLVKLSLARLAYQAKQYNQSISFYDEVAGSSPFSREAVYESAWSLYRMEEYNRSLGMLHALGSAYFESRDLPELWILRSLNYLKLCRFDEARKASNTFEALLKKLQPELETAKTSLAHYSLSKASDLVKSAPAGLPTWVTDILLVDPVFEKDLSTENLLVEERERLSVLALNPRVADVELKASAMAALQEQINKKIGAVGRALRPYILNRVSDISSEYVRQKERLDFLRFEIYSQATRFPKALERPEAQKLLSKNQFLPGVFLKGREILWRFNGEYWADELRGYDYFIPTECQSEGI